MGLTFKKTVQWMALLLLAAGFLALAGKAISSSSPSPLAEAWAKPAGRGQAEVYLPKYYLGMTEARSAEATHVSLKSQDGQTVVHLSGLDRPASPGQILKVRLSGPGQQPVTVNAPVKPVR